MLMKREPAFGIGYPFGIRLGSPPWSGEQFGQLTSPPTMTVPLRGIGDAIAGSAATSPKPMLAAITDDDVKIRTIARTERGAASLTVLPTQPRSSVVRTRTVSITDETARSAWIPDPGVPHPPSTGPTPA
ncbi:hypothetical protein KRM28CT15_42980 [Krasilnikovia sp. M28-CT-15]